MNQEIGKSHDSKADLPRLFGMRFNGRKGEAGSIENIVEKLNCEWNERGEAIIVDGTSAAISREAPGDVDRAERTGFIGEERLLAAGIGRFDGPQVRRGIRPVDGVEEDDAWFTGLPCCLNQSIKDQCCREAPHGFRGPWIDECIGPASFDRAHEMVGEGDREIEIRHLPRLLLQRDEVENIRMVDPQDSHIGAASGSSLLDDVGGHVEDAHEGNRPGGESAGGGHKVCLGTEVAERESCASARLVDERLVLDCVEDGF